MTTVHPSIAVGVAGLGLALLNEARRRPPGDPRTRIVGYNEAHAALQPVCGIGWAGDPATSSLLQRWAALAGALRAAFGSRCETTSGAFGIGIPRCYAAELRNGCAVELGRAAVAAFRAAKAAVAGAGAVNYRLTVRIPAFLGVGGLGASELGREEMLLSQPALARKAAQEYAGDLTDLGRALLPLVVIVDELAELEASGQEWPRITVLWDRVHDTMVALDARGWRPLDDVEQAFDKAYHYATNPGDAIADGLGAIAGAAGGLAWSLVKALLGSDLVVTAGMVGLAVWVARR